MFSISFKNKHTIFQKVLKCTVRPYEFNYSINPTLSDSNGILYDKANHPDFHTYVTHIGFYNDELELLAVAKLSKPVMISREIEMVFEASIDF